MNEWKKRLVTAFFLVCLGKTVLMPGAAGAEGLKGYLQLDYSRSETTDREKGGATTLTETDSMLQRYNLNFERTLFPYVHIKAGGIFEKLAVETTLEGEERDSTTKRTNGYADLTIANPLFRLGGGYAKRRERIDTEDRLPTILFRETTSAFAGIARREARPTLDALFLRTETYDQERVTQDHVRNQLSLTSQYRPVEQLDFRLSGGLSDTTDRLHRVETAGRSASGRASYTDLFFRDRMSFNTTYTASYETLERKTSRDSDFQLQVFPFSGLASLDDTPADGALTSLPALVDGDTTTGSGINIGRLPSTTGDTRLRNFGLDFATVALVNTLVVWLDREIPGDIAATYSWAIYLSNDNQVWTPGPPVTVRYEPFDARFVLTFTDISSRYLKAVTRPLSAAVPIPPGVDVDSVSITELQAFTRMAVTGEERRNSRGTSQIFDLNTRTLLLESPALVHDLFIWNRRTDPGGPSRYVLSNGLSLTKRFSSVLTGGARVGREDANEQGGHRGANLYGASLNITPLPSLSHSVVFSGRNERHGDLTSESTSLFLNNNAELYRGINASLSGGMSRATSETGEESKARIVNFGATLVPLPTLTLNAGYSDTVTKRWDPGPMTTSSTTTRDVSAAYTPVSTVHLFASLTVLSERGKPSSTIQNYAVTWTPFTGGSLLVTLPYTQTIRSADNARETSAAPNIRWMVNRSTSLTVSYQILTTETDLRDTRTKTAFADMRIVF